MAALGEDKAGNLVDQIIMGSGARGLDSLKWMDPRQVASIIQNEHPQIQTIVLSYLDPEQSAEILSQFPEQVRLDLIMRIANLEEVQPAALQELNDIMEKQFVITSYSIHYTKLYEMLAELEMEMIRQALDAQDGVVARAADMLGMRRTTLVEKMKKYGMSKEL